MHLLRGGTGELPAGPPQPLAAAAPDGTRAGSSPSPRVRPRPAARLAPVRVRVPAVRIDAPVTGVGLDSEGWIEAPPPEDDRLAGWFTGAVTPGERGTAVVVGHVDTPNGRAVFYDLGALGKDTASRSPAGTAVPPSSPSTGSRLSPGGLPAARIYGDSGFPELRLITCGGTFTEENGYAANVVVSARLVEVR
ncbi:sortase [Streptomyces diastatochromogenes]|nr:sortase [Streptomyces diastatochromogenes]